MFQVTQTQRCKDFQQTSVKLKTPDHELLVHEHQIKNQIGSDWRECDVV